MRTVIVLLVMALVFVTGVLVLSQWENTKLRALCTQFENNEDKLMEVIDLQNQAIDGLNADIGSAMSENIRLNKSLAGRRQEAGLRQTKSRQ